MTPNPLADRFKLTFDHAQYRRWIAGNEVIIHCHHYNARIQHTIEGATVVDGKKIFVSSATAVFASQLGNAIHEDDDQVTKQAVAEALYAHLGYGRLDLTGALEGTVTATESHFVEGWRAGFPARQAPVCSFTEGYIVAAVFAAMGRTVTVRETACMLAGATCCTFAVEATDDPMPAAFKSTPVSREVPAEETVSSPNVDEQTIVDALVAMPIHGRDDGLIPAFNVYLANTPADFYNLVCIRFVEEMERAGFGLAARTQLIHAGETCAMNTFRGILSSAEWDGLIAPMIREPRDVLFGLVAVSNALGWGNWRVRHLEPAKSLGLTSSNGYEAAGFETYRGQASEPMCLMLTGVSAGVMELLYGEGTVEERFGQYLSDEATCRTIGHESCHFDVEAA